jgi:hypothetical protein
LDRVDGWEVPVATDKVVVAELPPQPVTPTTTNAVVIRHVRA